MSRLDDELRQAFRRETPSADFAERVMKAVAAAPAPKRRWWDELLSLLAKPRVRLVAVGVAASLLILLWAAQSRRIQTPGRNENYTANKGASPVVPAPDTIQATPKETPKDDSEKHAVITQPRQQHVRKNAQSSVPRLEVAKSEGEIAKEQLMLALHIASASLNEAQRLVKTGD